MKVDVVGAVVIVWGGAVVDVVVFVDVAASSCLQNVLQTCAWFS